MPFARGTQRALAYVAIYGLWGGSFLAIVEVVRIAPPFFAAALRFSLAGLILYTASRLRGAPVPTARQWKHSALLGLIIFAGNYACLFWAEQRLASGIAAVLTAMTPVWIFLGEWLVFRTQRLTAGTTAGIVLGIGGVVLLSRASAGAHRAAGVAALVLLLGTLLFSVGTLWSRKLSLPPQQTTRAGLQMLLGGIFLFVLAFASGESSQLPAALHAWRWQTTAAMLYLIFAASIVAFTSYTWLIHHESATRVASYAYVNPVVALLLGIVLAGERISGAQWAGAALILLGVVATLSGRQGAVQRSTAQAAL